MDQRSRWLLEGHFDPWHRLQRSRSVDGMLEVEAAVGAVLRVGAGVARATGTAARRHPFDHRRGADDGHRSRRGESPVTPRADIHVGDSPRRAAWAAFRCHEYPRSVHATSFSETVPERRMASVRRPRSRSKRSGEIRHPGDSVAVGGGAEIPYGPAFDRDLRPSRGFDDRPETLRLAAIHDGPDSRPTRRDGARDASE
jgi:hypothetical protein